MISITVSTTDGIELEPEGFGEYRYLYQGNHSD